VSRAQQISVFLLERVKKRLTQNLHIQVVLSGSQAMCERDTTTHSLIRLSSYIDNFKGAIIFHPTNNATSSTPQNHDLPCTDDTRARLHLTRATYFLSLEAMRYGITLNDSAEEAAAAISPYFTHRGVQFFNHSTGALACRPSEKTRMKLEDALRSFDHVQFWTLDHSERVFSLCIYSSWVLDIPAYPWYYVYKYMRRRMRLVAFGIISRESRAEVWASIIVLWKNWLTTILQHQGRTKRHTENAPPLIVITDASKKGYGGVVFGLGGRYNLSSTSGTWTEEEGRRPIHELEQLALLRTCEHLVPLGREIHAVVDNTTVCQCTLRRRSNNYWLNKGVGILLSNWRVASASYITSEKNPADSLSRGLPLNVQLAVDAVLEFGQLGGSTNRVASDSTCCLCECV
jgi:hypothetical protein